jgi:hypothetical protein
LINWDEFICPELLFGNPRIADALSLACGVCALFLSLTKTIFSALIWLCVSPFTLVFINKSKALFLAQHRTLAAVWRNQTRVIRLKHSTWVYNVAKLVHFLRGTMFAGSNSVCNNLVHCASGNVTPRSFLPSCFASLLG